MSDALILATASIAPARIVVANDRSWPRVVKRAALGLEVFLLEG